MNFEALFVNPTGRTSRSAFVGALIVLLAAAGFYYWLVPGRSGQFALLVMLYPALVLHARRLHDVGRPGWPVLIPGAMLAAAGLLQLYGPEAEATRPMALASLVIAAGFVLWGLAGPSRAEPATA